MSKDTDVYTYTDELIARIINYTLEERVPKIRENEPTGKIGTISIKEYVINELKSRGWDDAEKAYDDYFKNGVIK